MKTSNADWVAKAQKVLLGNYRPAPLVLSRGLGCRVEDVEGKKYLDFCGGIAVLSVGHCHPELARAIGEQASRLMHVSNLFYNDRAIELAEQLASRTVFQRFFFCNSGTEANEAMLKLARRFHFERGDTERVEIVSTLQSFHGRTMGSLSMTGQTKYHAGMQPLVGAIQHVPYGDERALQDVVGPKTAAVILEPIQAEGGIIEPPDGYLQSVRKMCDQVGALLLFDEVQTGYGRTGRFLAREWSGVIPDACSLAKGIAGGFPLGAMAITEKVAAGLPPGSHAATFGGNPLACAAALAVLHIIDKESLIQNCAAMGEVLATELRALIETKLSKVATGIRGRGLLQGLVLSADIDPLKALTAVREHGLLASLAGANVLRFTPPLGVTEEEVREAMNLTASALSASSSRVAS